MAFLEEFKAADFNEARIIRTSRNPRTRHPLLVAAEVAARKSAP